jgi:glycine hydroxymethyltransferase
MIERYEFRHKTLLGPRGAMLMCRHEHAGVIDRAVFPGLQRGPHNHTTAGIAVALHEASQPSFRAYARQIVVNAQALAAVLVERLRPRFQWHRQSLDSD